MLKNRLNISLNQDIVLDDSRTGSSLIAISQYDYGICFLGYVSWQSSKTSILINVSNNFSVGLNSDGNVLLYFDSDYKLHIKFNKTEGHEALRLKYIFL